MLDAVIIGAGAAGLSAARDLHAAGARFTVLEARARIGGRIFTRRDSPLGPIELGAELIHGRADPLRALIDEAALPSVDIDGSRWEAHRGTLRPAEDFYDRLERVMGRLPKRPRHDYSFADFIGEQPGGARLAPDRRLAMQFVSSFHAADPTLVSGTVLADAGSPGDDEEERRLGRMVDGFASVIDRLATGITPRIRTSSIVTAVRWHKRRVEVETRGPRGVRSTLHSRAAIVTVPIGVLQATPGQQGAIAFDPDITRVRHALGQVAMGSVVRLVLQLRERFWTEDWFAPARRHDLSALSFLHTADRDFPVWWTAYPLQAPLLVAWCGGPHARMLSARSHQDLERLAVASLARQLRLTPQRARRLVVRSWMHNWQRDPFARGAYSYQLVGGADAPAALARPIERTLFFAGEATDAEGATGTVHGAISTGRRAAKQVLAALG